MKVSIDEDALVGLLAIAEQVYAPSFVGDVTRARAALREARAKRDHPRLEVDLAGGELLGVGPGPDDPSSRWDSFRKAARMLTDLRDQNAGNVSRADVVQSYARDVFDGFGLTLRDDDVLFAAIVTATLLVQLATNAHEREQITPEAVAAIAHVAQSFAIAVLDYLPPEARR